MARGTKAIRKKGVMEDMTPMADKQSNVDLVKDSSVGGMCYRAEATTKESVMFAFLPFVHR